MLPMASTSVASTENGRLALVAACVNAAPDYNANQDTWDIPFEVTHGSQQSRAPTKAHTYLLPGGCCLQPL